DQSGCTSTTAGPHQVSASLGSFVAAADLDIVAGPAANLHLTGTSEVTAGGTATYAVQGFDQYGNPLGDSTSTSTLTITPDGSCQGANCTATVAGGHVVTATLGSVTATAPLNVSPGAVDHLVVSPATATAPAGQWQTFTAQGFDQY